MADSLDRAGKAYTGKGVYTPTKEERASTDEAREQRVQLMIKRAERRQDIWTGLPLTTDQQLDLPQSDMIDGEIIVD